MSTNKTRVNHINVIHLRYILISLIFLSKSYKLHSQENIDSSLNIYNPSISTLILNKQQWEIGYHSSFSSYNYLATPTGISKGEILFVTNFLQLTWGLNKNFAIGLDASRVDNFYEINNSIDTSINYLKMGPRIRWSVFQRQNSNFVIQNYLRLPVNVYESKATNENMEFTNQFVLTNKIGNNILLTNQLDILYIKELKSKDKPTIILPHTIFLSYIFNTETIIFSYYQYQFNNQYYYLNNVEKKYDYFVHNIGIGAQLRLTKRLLTNLYYRYSFETTYQSSSNSINLGLRYITR